VRAVFWQPYVDNPQNSGLLVSNMTVHTPHSPLLPASLSFAMNGWWTREQAMYEWAHHADKAGLQLCVHAIGDQANTIMLDVFADVRSSLTRSAHFSLS
jgi:hypothetical protein